MAKLSPPYIDRNCKSSGERMIFEMFKKDAFTKDWIVLHSLNLSQNANRLYGEIDFLLLIPKAGIFVLEVKGGDVKCKDGIWHFIDRFGNSNINKSPFNQARDAMFSLKAAIKKEFGENHSFNRIQYGFFVAFPQVNFDKHSVEYEQWQIFDKGRYNSNHQTFFNELIQQFSLKHKTQPWFSVSDSLPEHKDLMTIYDFLRGDFERVRTMEDKISEFENQVKIYTSEQFIILDSVEINERSVIQGSAGTGKTMIAIEAAIRAASEGKRIFLTCFNRLIGDWMQKQVEGWKENITVSSLHSYLFELCKGFDYDTSQVERQDFYTSYLPMLLKTYFDIGISEKYDLLIVDEGQDLIRKEYLELFNSLLHGGLNKGCWQIYGDFESQSIYSQLSKSEMFYLLGQYGFFSNFLLKINCRNTKQIGEETSLISGFDKPPFLLEYLEGTPVEYYFYHDEVHQNKLLFERLKKFSDENLPHNHLVILSPSRLEKSGLVSFHGYSIKEIKPSKDVIMDNKSYGFATIHAYKGMESNIVIMTDINDLSSLKGKSLMYVGMSRAKFALILFISETARNQYYDIILSKSKK